MPRRWARALTAFTVRPRSAAMSMTEALETMSCRSRSSSPEVHAFALFNFFVSVSPGPGHLNPSNEPGRVALVCRIVSLRALTAFVATHLRPDFVVTQVERSRGLHHALRCRGRALRGARPVSNTGREPALNPTPAARAAMVQRAMRYGCHLRSAGKIWRRFGSRPSAKEVQAARGVDRVRWAAKRMRTC